MGGVNLSINKMEFSLAISQLLLVQLGKFVDTIIFEIVEHLPLLHVYYLGQALETTKS